MVLCLCVGRLPDGSEADDDADDEKDQVMEMIKLAVMANALVPVQKENICYQANANAWSSSVVQLQDELLWFYPADFARWAAEKFSAFPEKLVTLVCTERPSKVMQAEPKPSHLLAIAGLLELLLDESRPRYQQGTVAEAIEAKGWQGASVSTLTKLFAEAKSAAKDAEKNAKAKAEALQAAVEKTQKS
jgi:hypothetical protein